MDKNYYDETLFRIEKFMAEDKYAEAKKLIDEELSMPYLPAWFQNELEDLQADLRPESEDKLIVDPEKLKQLLQGDLSSQVAAISHLCRLNLHNYKVLVAEYLGGIPASDAAGLLISAMIDQGIKDSYCYKKAGETLNFVPADLTQPYEAPGFLNCLRVLNELLENEHPAEKWLAYDLLTIVGYNRLPGTIKSDECEKLVPAIICGLFPANKEEIFAELKLDLAKGEAAAKYYFG